MQSTLDEFDLTLTSAEVHKQIQERKKSDNENFHEYICSWNCGG